VIKPAVDFASLEAVLIVLTPPAATETTGAATTGTAGKNQGRE
jgi:hypothetical protein